MERRPRHKINILLNFIRHTEIREKVNGDVWEGFFFLPFSAQKNKILWTDKTQLNFLPFSFFFSSRQAVTRASSCVMSWEPQRGRTELRLGILTRLSHGVS